MPDDLDLPHDTFAGPVAPDLPRRLAAEAIGSAFLLIAVIGSGIMAQTLSPDDVGLQLLENAAATTGALIALIIMFATVSGAHFNPAVTLVERLLGAMTTREATGYVGAQLVGGCVGTMLANAMFSEQTGRGIVFFSERDRNSWAELLSEVIATVGLLLVIHGAVRHAKPYVVGVAVGVWIGGAYFFTSSTSFANPMVSVARTLSDTFAGIAPASAPGFVAAQLVGAIAAWGLIRWLFADPVATDDA
jgi:glycerol uptake facilitator-like aquaporin